MRIRCSIVGGFLVCLALTPFEARGSPPDSPPDLSGVWAQKVVMTSVSDPPVVGTVTSRTITYLKYVVAQSNRSITVESQTCDVSVRSESSMVRTVLPQRFANALPDQRRTGRLTWNDDSTILRLDESYSVLGAELESPKSDSLPTRPNDPNVVDADSDGHPGVTVLIRGLIDGEIYVVQRAWDRYHGRVVSPQRVTGRVSWEVDQRILDATSLFLTDRPPTRPHSDPAKSFFEMVRTSSGMSCADIMAQKNSLFERTVDR